MFTPALLVRFQRTTIDLSLPWRFANLPNNAKLEIVPCTGRKQAVTESQVSCLKCVSCLPVCSIFCEGYIGIFFEIYSFVQKIWILFLLKKTLLSCYDDFFFFLLRPLGLDCSSNGKWASTPRFFLMWTESLGSSHTFPPDQVCGCGCGCRSGWQVGNGPLCFCNMFNVSLSLTFDTYITRCLLQNNINSSERWGANFKNCVGKELHANTHTSLI